MVNEIDIIEKEIRMILEKRKDLLSFFFRSGKNQKENTLLMKNRKNLAEILLWDVSEKIKSVSGTYLFKIEDENLSFSRINENICSDTLSRLLGFPDFYFIIGHFEMRDNSIKYSNSLNFYMEIPASLQITGTLNPFLIENYA